MAFLYKDNITKDTVYFVGAGPGDPELLTIKARKLLLNADIVIYTGSLIPKEIVRGLNARVIDSSGLTLEQLVEIMGINARAGRLVVRLHTGDPSLYSAIQEQIFELERQGINCIVVPGVSAGFAASARLGLELTIPGISQTVIISRISGRTKVPEEQKLNILAKTKSTLLLYLSISHIKKVVKELLDGGLHENTPVVVAEKVTWPEERIIFGTLKDISKKVEDAGIKKTAIVMVGEVLRAYKKGDFERSRLYSAEFSHGYRKALIEDKDRSVESVGLKKESTRSYYDIESEILHTTSKEETKREKIRSREEVKTNPKQRGDRRDLKNKDYERYIEQHIIEQKPANKIYISGSYIHARDYNLKGQKLSKGSDIAKLFPHSIIIFYVTRNGRYLAERLSAFFPGAKILPYSSIKKHDLLKKYWQKGRGLIFIMATGIVVRTIAPHLKEKASDPAIVVMDESGNSVISLVSGHLGGANRLASYISKMIGAKPIITTASDNLGLVPFDIWVFEKGLIPESKDSLKRAQSKLVDTGILKIFTDILVSDWPKGLMETKDINKADVIISYKLYTESKPILRLFPKVLCLGVGCNRGIKSNILIEKAITFLKEHKLSLYSLSSIATIDIKKDEKAIIELAEYLGVPLKFFNASELDKIPVTSGSDIVLKAVGTKAVAEPAAILAAKDEGYNAELIIPKEKRGEVTFAITKKDLIL